MTKIQVFLLKFKILTNVDNSKQNTEDDLKPPGTLVN